MQIGNPFVLEGCREIFLEKTRVVGAARVFVGAPTGAPTARMAGRGSGASGGNPRMECQKLEFWKFAGGKMYSDQFRSCAVVIPYPLCFLQTTFTIAQCKRQSVKVALLKKYPKKNALLYDLRSTIRFEAQLYDWRPHFTI